jgi:hypothetical protein
MHHLLRTWATSKEGTDEVLMIAVVAEAILLGGMLFVK